MIYKDQMIASIKIMKNLLQEGMQDKGMLMRTDVQLLAANQDRIKPGLEKTVI